MSKHPFAGVFLAFAIVAPAVAQESAQLFAGTNGEIEATYSSNNCVVYYDASGRRKNANRNCSAAQIKRSDTGVAAYRREQGMDGPPGSEAPPGGFGRPGSHHDGPPEVVMDGHGRGHVLVGGECIVYYGRDGARESTNHFCSGGDNRTADDAMRSYRREQGMSERNSSGYPYGITVLQLRNGKYQATVSGTCTVYFNDRGGLLIAMPKCTTAEKANAALAVVEYRRNH